MASVIENAIRGTVTKGIEAVAEFNRKRMPDQDHPFLTGIHEPMDRELTLENLSVTGKIPAELDGRYLRIGPNPARPEAKGYHWFTGDGMVHGIALRQGKALWYRNRWIRSKRLEADRGLLANAQLADALSSRARNVFVFFADLFGMREVYNSPGTTGLDNWSLRAPSDFERSYEERAKNCEALDLPLALSMALRSRGDDESRALAQRLESNGIPGPAGR